MTIKDLRRWGNHRVPMHREGDPFTALQRELNQLWGGSWGDFPPLSWPGVREGDFIPQVDVTETDTELQVSVELPGMAANEVELSLNGETLTLTGEKKTHTEAEEAGRYHTERFYGRFRRVIPLPVPVASDKVHARFTNGVLIVALPKAKTAEETVRKIDIKAA